MTYQSCSKEYMLLICDTVAVLTVCIRMDRVIVTPTTKNATTKNHPKDILCNENNLYRNPPSIKYFIYNLKTLSGGWIVNFAKTQII